jgi:hypothetical protein
VDLPTHHQRGLSWPPPRTLTWPRTRGLGKPDTFDFLGFTHICGKTRAGRFWRKRKTISKRMRAKLAEVKDQCLRRRHQPIPLQGRWLAGVVRGHLAYYAVPGNSEAIGAFRSQRSGTECGRWRRGVVRDRGDLPEHASHEPATVEISAPDGARRSCQDDGAMGGSVHLVSPSGRWKRCRPTGPVPGRCAT